MLTFELEKTFCIFLLKTIPRFGQIPLIHLSLLFRISTNDLNDLLSPSSHYLILSSESYRTKKNKKNEWERTLTRNSQKKTSDSSLFFLLGYRKKLVKWINTCSLYFSQCPKICSGRYLKFPFGSVTSRDLKLYDRPTKSSIKLIYVIFYLYPFVDIWKSFINRELIITFYDRQVVDYGLPKLTTKPPWCLN